MSELKQTSWKMFNKIAPSYDHTNGILSFGMHHKWRKELAKHLPKEKNISLLDIATGTGDQIISLFEKNSSIKRAVGVDLAKEMLLIAKEKISKKPFHSKVDLLCADASKLPFSDDSFHAATFSFGIRNVPDPSLALTEIERVLKPAGKCLILEFSLPPQPIRLVYLTYLRYFLPKIGGALSKSQSSYSYLNQTIEEFPSGQNFLNLMKKAGLTKLEIHPMALGAVTLYVGQKK